MDLVNEQHVAGVQIGQDSRQIACLGQHGARGHPEVHTKLARHDLCQRGFAQPGRAMEQRVIHRLAALPGAFDEHPQIRARLSLPDKGIQALRPQRAVRILGPLLGPQCGIRLGHLLLSLAQNYVGEREKAGLIAHCDPEGSAKPFATAHAGANRFNAARINALASASGSSRAASATAFAASAGA